MREGRLSSYERSKYSLYLKKARDFHVTMRSALAAGNWNSAGLEAVHCAISATDALLAYTSGIHSTSEGHRDVVHLLRTHVQAPDTARNADHLQAILAMKSDIEYIARNFSRKEAEDIVKHAERYFAWVCSLLPSH